MYRISGAEGAEGGFEVEDAAAVCQMLEAAGVCAISVSAGNWYALHQTIGPMFLPRGFLVPLAAVIKRAVSVPVIAVGRLDDAALAEKILADGDGDMIAIGRALIADPDCRGSGRREGSTRSAPASPATPASTSSRTRSRPGAPSIRRSAARTAGRSCPRRHRGA